MAYVFDLDVNEALGLPGWFFVFQEPRAVPRYGFDVSTAAASHPGTMGGPTCRSHARSSSTSTRPWRSGLPIRAARVGGTATDMANITFNVRSGSSSTHGHSSMSNLDLIEARGQLVARREQLSACEAALVDNELRSQERDSTPAGNCKRAATDPDTAAVRAFRQRELGVLPEEREKLEEQRDTLTQEIDTLAVEGRNARGRGAGAVDVDRHAGCALSGRIETCFKPAASGCDLLVRIYPDDLHLDATPGPLTGREYEAGQAYWQSVWPAMGNGGTLKQTIAEAWKALGRHIDPARIALVADATRPENAPRDLTTAPTDAAPRFPPRRQAESGDTRAALMPDAWTVYGLRDGELLFSERGKPIPAVLPVSAMRRQASAGDETPREWLVDFDLAVEVGMALSVHLEDREPSNRSAVRVGSLG